MRWEYLNLRNQLAATFTALAFALIGPYARYAGVNAQAESVLQTVCQEDVCVCRA